MDLVGIELVIDKYAPMMGWGEEFERVDGGVRLWP